MDRLPSVRSFSPQIKVGLGQGNVTPARLIGQKTPAWLLLTALWSSSASGKATRYLRTSSCLEMVARPTARNALSPSGTRLLSLPPVQTPSWPRQQVSVAQG